VKTSSARLTGARYVFTGATALILTVSPASADPSESPSEARSADALREDIERIVSAEESSGWSVDSVSQDAVFPVVLQSVCHASERVRELARDRLAEDEATAGDPKTLFDDAHKQMTANVTRALHIQRMHVAIERAMHERCPFWIVPVERFDGRQTDRDRFTLNLESGGGLQVRYANDDVRFGFGPAARLLAGYTFRDVGILGGVELAGGLMARDDDSSRFAINYFQAIPVMVRLRSGSWLYALEAGPLSFFQGHDTRLSFGVRGGGAVGIMALRTRTVIPWAGVAATYDHFFESGGRPTTELLRVGLRFGLIYGL
jgi:hypothetical protein